MSMIEGLIGNTGGALEALGTSSSIGKEDFFEMLIAQLQNQDPLNPLEGTDFTAQLAQFSSLEQLYNMTEQMGMLGLYQSSMNNAMAASLVGKEITASGNSVIVDGSSAEIAYALESEAGKVTVSIYDEDGSLVDTIESGTGGLQAGGNKITWDCSGIESGTYTFEVSALSMDGSAIAVDTVMSGTVTGVTFVDGVPYLMIGGRYVSLGDVVSVNETEA